MKRAINQARRHVWLSPRETFTSTWRTAVTWICVRENFVDPRDEFLLDDTLFGPVLTVTYTFQVVRPCRATGQGLE